MPCRELLLGPGQGPFGDVVGDFAGCRVARVRSHPRTSTLHDADVNQDRARLGPEWGFIDRLQHARPGERLPQLRRGPLAAATLLGHWHEPGGVLARREASR